MSISMSISMFMFMSISMLGRGRFRFDYEREKSAKGNACSFYEIAPASRAASDVVRFGHSITSILTCAAKRDVERRRKCGNG